MIQPKFEPINGSPAGLQLPPPFDFRGVSMRVFPVRASMSQLRSFCNSFLNIVPPEVGEFRPAAPFVYIMVLNYGRMSIEAANMGWIAQHEVTFSVALEWHRRVGDRMVLQDWAYVSPFIYVDNDLSMTTGRRVYGWPKSMSWLDRSLSSWTSHPVGPSSLFSLSAMVFPRAYAGAQQERRVLFDVIHNNVGLADPQFPPRLDDWLSLMTSVPTATVNSIKLMNDFAQILGGFGLLRGQGLRDLYDAAGRMVRDFNPVSPNISFNTVNLKQFRDSEIPDAACYQALVNAPMVLTKFNAGGPLGMPQLINGDFSGGYRLDLHRYDSQPIIETLGIDVAEERSVGGLSVSSLEPVFPFWMDVDMKYNLGQTLAWRTRDTDWVSDYGFLPGRRPVFPASPLEAPGQGGEVQSDDGPLMPGHIADGPSSDDPFAQGSALPGSGPADTAPAAPAAPGREVPGGARSDARSHDRSYHMYNSTLGASTQELAGPFDYPNTTIRVLPLLADPARLETFCADHLHTDVVMIRPYGSYVYLLVLGVEEALSRSGNVGGWGFREVAFAVPVKIYRRDNGELIRTAMIMPYVFIDNSMAANTFSEVLGLEAEESRVISPPDSWLGESGPATSTSRQLLDVVTRVFPAVNAGQKAVERSVVQAMYGDILPYNDDVRWRFVAEDWGRTLVDEYQRKTGIAGDSSDEFLAGQALALELLCNKEPFGILTLKQFRSAERPSEACYQSLVNVPIRIEQIYDLREISDLVHVKVRNYPSLPIMDKLGLKAKWVSTEDCDEVYNLQPVRPFWMKVSLSQGLGQKLAERAGSMVWYATPGLDAQSMYLLRDEPPRVGRELVDRITLRTDLTYYWKDSGPDGEEPSGEKKGLLADTMNLLTRLVELLQHGAAKDSFALATESINILAEISDGNERGTGELVTKLEQLATSLEHRGSARTRALAAEVRQLLPHVRGERGAAMRSSLTVLTSLIGSIKQETEAEARALNQDIEGVLRRITQGYESNRHAMQRFRQLLKQEPDEDAKRVAGLLASVLERVGRLLESSREATSELVNPADVGSSASWSALQEQMKELARDDTSREIIALARKLYQPPQRLRTVVNDWLKEVGDRSRRRLSRDEAKKAIEAIEPQLVIESVLSREWEDWGRPRWYRGKEQKPDFAVLRDSIGFEYWRDLRFPHDQSFDEQWYGKRGDVRGESDTGIASLVDIAFDVQVPEGE